MRKISKTYKVNRDRLIYIPSDKDKVIHSKINSEIRKKYNINLKSRDSIIESLISIFTQGDYSRVTIPKIDYTIVRTDIENFFPSINKHKLYQKLSKSNVLSKESIDILKPMFFHKSIEGVPLGFSFSSSLAEIYLEDFDDQLNFVFNPVFYFRYVDDIIIVLNDNNQSENKLKDQYYKMLEKIFNRNELKINETKTNFTFWRGSGEANFNYLGYSFIKNKKHLIIDIADEKFSKILKQIRGYFYYYKHSHKSKKEFWTLYYRLKTRIYGITSDTEKNLKFGMGFSYKHINSNEKLIKLIKLISYNIRALNLTSYERNTLFSLIQFNNEEIEILKRRLNFNRLTHNQLNKICNRLKIPLFEQSSKKNKVKMIFKEINIDNEKAKKRLREDTPIEI